jgi:hypothetical protein
MSTLHQYHDFSPPSPLEYSSAVSGDLFADVLETYCSRTKTMMHTDDAAKLAKLIDSGAWTDAVLALLALELPQWQVRRLVYDEGQWHCALSEHREMPDWLDESVEMHHADLALAILSAIIEAKIQLRSSRASQVSMARPSVPEASFEPMCCDNFS